MEKMKDKNGKEMITGQVVKIENAYFKNDNGFYFIKNSPGDASWCGSDYGLQKINKNGTLSTASRNIAFWPLSAFTNNKQKNRECKEHNKQFATIEILETIDNSQVIKHFQEESEKLIKYIERLEWDFGKESPVVTTQKEIKKHYEKVIERIQL